MTRLLVDARPLTHPTAGGRGVGNHVAGLLEGLGALAADAVALVEHDAARAVVPSGLPADRVEVLGRDVVRRHARDGTWFVATAMNLHPVSLDPIPASVTEARLPVAALLYDVIPYRYPDQYLVEDDPRRQAALRLLWSRTVDVHAANSAFVARTAVEELGIDPARTRVTGAAAAARFVPAAPGVASPRTRPYVVAVTGADARKNTDGALRAWARTSRGTRDTHDLVVVATPSARRAAAWRDLAGSLGVEVDFAIGLDDDAVVSLLQHASLGVVPSLEEGFGLPVLEVAACGVPVVCSDASSLPEVLTDAAARFDPHDADTMAAAIDRALTDDAHRTRLLAAGRAAVDRWQWDRVAADLIAAVEELGPRTGAVVRPPRRREVVAVAPAFADARVAWTDDVVPAAAIGRYVKRHDLDTVHIVTGRPPGDGDHG